MKNAFLVTVFVFLTASVFSQTLPNSFIILNNKNPDKESFYKNSIQTADMEQYRLRGKRVRLTFENGFEIELLSAKEVFLNNQQININNYETALAKDAEFPVFNILDSGHLTAKVFSKSNK